MEPLATTPGSQAWLAPPQAAGRFDPARQSPADAARWPTLNAPGRRREWAASRALLAHLTDLGERHASLSHSQGWSAALLAPEGLRVGLDLEWLRPRDVLALARHAYDPREVEALEALPEPERALRFHLLWTLKEACAKALGLGLMTATRTCSFSESGGRWTGVIACDGNWAATVYAPRPGAVLAVLQVAHAGQPLPGLSCHEWPEPIAAPWPLLAEIRSVPR